MSDGSSEPSEETAITGVPIGAIPGPLACYSVQAGTPVIERTNESFEGVFGTGAPGSGLRDWLERSEWTVADRSAAEVCDQLAEGSTIDVDLHRTDETAATQGEAERYRIQSARATNAEQSVDGCLLFTERSLTTTPSLEIDWLASVISHDLRNPLDVAKARLTAARETGEEEHFEHLERAHTRMERIIEGVLLLTREGNTAVDTSQADLEAVVDRAWSTVDTGDATLEVDEELPCVKADPEHLRRLFENLFRNSIEHGFRGSRAASGDGRDRGECGASAPDAEATTVDTESSELRVRVGSTENGFFVSDTGQGIPTEEREAVFEPGYSSQEGGTGIGLTIVEQIAEAHGWTVSLGPETSDGVRFEFEYE